MKGIRVWASLFPLSFLPSLSSFSFLFFSHLSFIVHYAQSYGQRFDLRLLHDNAARFHALTRPSLTDCGCLAAAAAAFCCVDVATAAASLLCLQLMQASGGDSTAVTATTEPSSEKAVS